MRGYVEEVRDGIAYLSFEDEEGNHYDGNYPADQLAAMGIHEQKSFEVCTAELEDGEVAIFMRSVPDRELSDAEVTAINQRVDNLCKGLEADDV